MMTEPVAYYREDSNGMRIYYDKVMLPELDSNDIKVKPLYDKNSLHPRVKMTQKQYDRLMWDKQNTDLSTCISYFLEHDGVNKFSLSSENLIGLLTQEDIARAWLNPEETIEIVPEMKWFVQIKNKSELAKFLRKTEFNVNYIKYGAIKLYAQQFDTKYEAELWTNPLTEAVQLPVEDE